MIVHAARFYSAPMTRIVETFSLAISVHQALFIDEDAVAGVGLDGSVGGVGEEVRHQAAQGHERHPGGGAGEELTA